MWILDASRLPSGINMPSESIIVRTLNRFRLKPPGNQAPAQVTYMQQARDGYGRAAVGGHLDAGAIDEPLRYCLSEAKFGNLDTAPKSAINHLLTSI